MVPPASRGIPRAPRYSGSCESRRRSGFAYGAVTRSGRPFQVVRLPAGLVYLVDPLRGSARTAYNPRYATAAALTRSRFRLFPVRSPLLGESRLISLPRGTKMFQFPRFPPGTYGFSAGCRGMTHGALPHSGIPGSAPADGSPRLFAAYHALHRLLAPRHPPYALPCATPAPSRARHTPDLAQCPSLCSC